MFFGFSITEIVLFAAILALLIMVLRLEVKLRRMLIGKSLNLHDAMVQIAHELEKHEKFRNSTSFTLEDINKRLKRSVQAVRTIRFNPFKGTGSGGNQSFSTAFLAEDGNGVVVSTLYSRDHVSVFGKPIENGASKLELTEEEQQAVTEAKNSLK